MTKDSDRLAASFETENTGVLTGLLAEENVFDRRTLWRLGSWGLASVGAVVVALYANQSSIALRREEAAAADLARQARQIQSVAKESQNETLRLASAIDTLNSDRDRLYSRVTVLEQGLDSVTGAIARQGTAGTSPPAAPAPAALAEPQVAAPKPSPTPAPVATTAAKTADKPSVGTMPPEQGPAKVASVPQKDLPQKDLAQRDLAQKDPVQKDPDPPSALPATALVASKSIMAPPDSAATKLIEPEKPKPVEPEKPAKAITAAPMPEVVASALSAPDGTPDPSQAEAPNVAVQRTEFGVDVGGANSVGGLRALWRGLLKSRSNAPLATLRPIIVIKEGRNGLGMQLRLVAGPLYDAAAAAKICAGLIENDRPCETTVFEGQRLAMKADEQPAAAADKPGSAKPATGKGYWHRRSAPKRVEKDEPVKKPDPPSTFSSFFKR
jgi:hypothetical protein